MRSFIISITLGLALTIALPAGAQEFSTARDLRLSFNADGTVNLAARNVTVRDILAEWARQCQCHVVNAERLPGGAIMLPLQFEQASQSTVLESLLRQAAGYVLTPRRAGVQSASNYETIYILATSNPVAGAYVPPPPQASQAFMPTTGSPDDELPPVRPISMGSTIPPPGQPPSQPPASPFGSRSTSPFVSITPVPGTATGPGGVAQSPTAPGAVTPAPAPGGPGTAMPASPAPPLPSGSPVPIVPIAPPGP